MEQKITAIITEVYGDKEMARSLAAMIWAKIETGDKWGARGREWEMMIDCWNFFPGGGTAEIVAKRIEAALVEAGI